MTDLLIIQHTGRFEQYLGELAYICSLIVVPNRKSDDLPFNRIIITISTKGLLGDTHHVHWGSTQCSCHHLTRKEPCKPKVSWRKDSQIKFTVDQHFFTKWFQNRLLRISNIKISTVDFFINFFHPEHLTMDKIFPGRNNTGTWRIHPLSQEKITTKIKQGSSNFT